MGAWGAGPFENDDAMDWAIDLEESGDVGFVVEALRAAEGDGYLDAPEGSVTMAAAEVVAALDPGPRWRRAGDGRAGDADGGDGQERSRGSELWDEAGQPEGWNGAVDGLLARLGRQAPSHSRQHFTFVRLLHLCARSWRR